MAWQPIPTTLELESLEKALTIEQFQSLPDANDRIGFRVYNEGQLVSNMTFKVKASDGQWHEMTGGEFWTTRPGEYLVQMISVDDANNTLQVVNKQIRICNSFRRYIIPDTYVCIDVNKPWGYIGNDPVIHVLNGYYDEDLDKDVFEDVILTMLHPEDPGGRSDVGIFVHIDGSNGELLDIDGNTAGNLTTNRYQALRLRFDISDSDPGWDYDPVSGDEFMDVDVHAGVVFGDEVDKFLMMNVPRDFRIRVWKSFAANRTSSDMAIMPDTDVRALLESIPTIEQYRFRGRVRTVGAVGTVQASNPSHADGQWVDVTSVTDYLLFALTTYDNYAISYSSGTSVDINAHSNVNAFLAADIPMTQPVEAIVNQVHAYPPSFGPAEYHWMSIRLDKDARYLLHILPLAISPTNIPVVNGFQSLIPLDIMIEDTDDHGHTDDYDLGPIYLGFKEEFTQWSVFDPDTFTFIPKRLFGSRMGNPLKMNIPYRMWLRCPGSSSAANSTLQFNGVDFVTFSVTSCNLNDTSQTNFLRNISKWVALGNFTYLINDSDPTDTSMHRAAYITENFRQYELDVGMAEYVDSYAFTGIENLTNSSLCCGYHLAAGNWQGAVDDWMAKMKTFIIDESNWCSWLEDDGSQRPSQNIESLTNYGLDLGLPFGLHTAYYTGSAQFDVNRNVISFVSVYYWLNLMMRQDGSSLSLNYPDVGDGVTNAEKLGGTICVAKSWETEDGTPDGNPYYRCVWVAVGDPNILIEDEGQTDLGAGVLTNTTPLELSDAQLNINYGDPGYIDLLYLHAGPLWVVETFVELDTTFGDIVWFDFAINTYADFGYGADKTGDRPYLITPDKLVSYDPLATDERVISNADFTSSESYDNNQVIQGQFSQTEIGFLAMKGAALIHRGHAILARDSNGNLVHGFGAN